MWSLVLLRSATAESCFICDEVVELDSSTASCFNQIYEDALAYFQLNEGGFAKLDLTQCSGGSATTSRGLDRFSDKDPAEIVSESPASGKVRSVYFLDKPSVECIQQKLVAHSGPIDPSLRIDIAEECR